VVPQHSVLRLFHGMKPPEPLTSMHQVSLVPPAGVWTWKRSGEPLLFLRSSITPALVGVAVISAAFAVIVWLRLTPSIALPE
jgi:hypothetical protein